MCSESDFKTSGYAKGLGSCLPERPPKKYNLSLARVAATYHSRFSSSTVVPYFFATMSGKEVPCGVSLTGNFASHRNGTHTTGHSSPLAEWTVDMVTLLPPSIFIPTSVHRSI